MLFIPSLREAIHMTMHAAKASSDIRRENVLTVNLFTIRVNYAYATLNT